MRSRERSIVSEAAKLATGMVASWLDCDERGTWEKRAKELLGATKEKAERLGLDDAEVNRQISIFLASEATEAALRQARRKRHA